MTAKRQKFLIPHNGLQHTEYIARNLFRQGDYDKSFDIFEQLLESYPEHSTRLLAEVYNLYQLLPSKDRYTMYQSRFFNFGIKPGDTVIDIGSGNVPFPLATHLADLTLSDDGYGRAGCPFKYLKGKPVYECNIEKMPFADKEFDFVYCSHVLEHVDNPEKACSEIMRVGKRGYIETPRSVKDLFFNIAKVSNHRWEVEFHDNKLTFREYDCREIDGLGCDLLRDMSCTPANDREKAINALIHLKADVMNTMLLWDNYFDYEVKRVVSSTVGRKHKSGSLQSEDNPLIGVEASVKEPVRISYIVIVLNGMPFLEQCLKAIYVSAHEIIVVEGAVENCMFAANPDGSSKDGTVEFLRSFPDPAGKVNLIQSRWPEKCEMQNAALEHVTGDYVWLVDSDEIYRHDDIRKICNILENDTEITQVNFIPDNFWKGFDFIFVSPLFFEPAHHYRRIFKFVPGARFTSHRPPTMKWPGLDRSTEEMKLLDGATTRKMQIYPYHYSYVLEDQVRQKIELYNRYGWGNSWNIDMNEWLRECYLAWTPENKDIIEKKYPVWTGGGGSHTTPFTRSHPEVMIDFIGKFMIRQQTATQNNTSIHPSDEQERNPCQRRVKIAGEVASSNDLTAVNGESQFAIAIRNLFARIKPARIIETGTYTGEGTTKVIASTLRELGIADTCFYSIECNPVNYQRALANLGNSGLLDKVSVLHGLSVPRALLPTLHEIEEKYVTGIEFDDIFVDHQEKDRALLYFKETDFGNIPDDLLGETLRAFNYRPNFVLLDSGGHMGNVEFNYVLSLLQGECFIALDDINHVKHHTSYRQIKGDPRFSLITESNEKFGFCIAKFTPETYTNECVRSIIWARPDSIGDNILAMSMLPHLKNRYPDAEITVFCQQHIAELYEASPVVARVITFNRPLALQDDAYRREILAGFRNLRRSLSQHGILT